MAKYAYVAVASLLVATPALAEFCTFTIECFEGDGCYDTNFEMTIEDTLLVTDAESIPVTISGSDATNVFVGQTSSAIHVVTREVGGAARYSTHIFDGVLMVNYLGTCE